MLKPLIFVLLLGAANARWGEDSCPASCNCHLGELRDDLLATSWNVDQSAAKVHPNEAVHLTQGETINFHGIMKTAVCVYQSNIGLDEWFQQLPLDVEALTIMQAPGGGQVVMEERHLHPFASLLLLDVQGGAHNGSGLMVLKSNCLQSLRTLQYLSLRHIRFQGQPEVAPPRPPARYTLHELPSDLTQWKSMQSVVPHEIVFLTEEEPVPYEQYKAAVEHADMSIFSGLDRLRVLRVDHCGVTQIKWQMFQGLRNLEWLSLEGNEMPYVPDFAFYGTPHLKHLSLAHNRILSMHFTNLAGLLELERLDMSHNNLSHLSELSLPPLPQLLEADFRHNPLEAVYKATFEIMNRTERLFLGGETPLRLQDGGLSGLDGLRTLVISNAQIKVLDQATLKGIGKLKSLRIQGQVDEIAYDAFSAAAKMEKLVLKDCQLKVVSMDAFYGLIGLVVLDLSDNNLETLPPGLFDQLGSLKELQLHNNKFTTLPEDIFVKITPKMIRLDGNPWHCTCDMREWRPMSINKVKVQVDRTIQLTEAKGGAEVRVRDTQYRFEKKAAPTCKTPAEYVGWSVFHVMRKELKCSLSESKREFIEKRRIEAKKFASAVKNFANRTMEKMMPPLVEKYLKNVTTTLKPLSASEISNQVPEVVVQSVETVKKPEPEKTKTLTHQGTVIKVSKKAYKLEMERKRQEKLRRMELDSHASEPSNLI